MKSLLSFAICLLFIGCSSEQTSKLGQLEKSYGEVKEGFYGFPMLKDDVYKTQEYIYLDQIELDNGQTAIRFRLW